MADESSEKFLTHLRAAMGDGSLTRLTLGAHRGSDPTLRRLVVRPVVFQAGPRFAFVWSHATRDITKNHTADEAVALDAVRVRRGERRVLAAWCARLA